MNVRETTAVVHLGCWWWVVVLVDDLRGATDAGEHMQDRIYSNLTRGAQPAPLDETWVVIVFEEGKFKNFVDFT